MKDLRKEELLKWFDEVWSKCKWGYAIKKHDKRAYQQIEEMIQEDNMRRDMIIENRVLLSITHCPFCGKKLERP